MAWSNTHYDALDCTVMAGGVYITGLSETMVTGSRDEEFFTTEVGAQRDAVENESNNSLGTILTLFMEQESAVRLRPRIRRRLPGNIPRRIPARLS